MTPAGSAPPMPRVTVSPSSETASATASKSKMRRVSAGPNVTLAGTPAIIRRGRAVARRGRQRNRHRPAGHRAQAHRHRDSGALGGRITCALPKATVTGTPQVSSEDRKRSIVSSHAWNAASAGTQTPVSSMSSRSSTCSCVRLCGIGPLKGLSESNSTSSFARRPRSGGIAPGQPIHGETQPLRGWRGCPARAGSRRSAH